MYAVEGRQQELRSFRSFRRVFRVAIRARRRIRDFVLNFIRSILMRGEIEWRN